MRISRIALVAVITVASVSADAAKPNKVKGRANSLVASDGTPLVPKTVGTAAQNAYDTKVLVHDEVLLDAEITADAKLEQTDDVSDTVKKLIVLYDKTKLKYEDDLIICKACIANSNPAIQSLIIPKGGICATNAPTDTQCVDVCLGLKEGLATANCTKYANVKKYINKMGDTQKDAIDKSLENYKSKFNRAKSICESTNALNTLQAADALIMTSLAEAGVATTISAAGLLVPTGDDKKNAKTATNVVAAVASVGTTVTSLISFDKLRQMEYRLGDCTKAVADIKKVVDASVQYDTDADDIVDTDFDNSGLAAIYDQSKAKDVVDACAEVSGKMQSFKDLSGWMLGSAISSGTGAVGSAMGAAGSVKGKAGLTNTGNVVGTVGAGGAVVASSAALFQIAELIYRTEKCVGKWPDNATESW